MPDAWQTLEQLLMSLGESSQFVTSGCQIASGFLSDPEKQVGRFPLRKDRRQHLHQRIVKHHLDLTHFRLVESLALIPLLFLRAATSLTFRSEI
jgi:hypothetical protein